MTQKKKDTIKSLAIHSKDVGSTEIQIGLLTDKIFKLSVQMNSSIITTEKDYLRLDENYKKNIGFIKISLKIKQIEELKNKLNFRYENF